MGLTTSKGLSLFPDTQTSPPTATGQALMSADSSGTLVWQPKSVVAGTGITATEDATSITLAATGGGVPGSGTTGDLLSWNGSAWVGSSVGTLGLVTSTALTTTLSNYVTNGTLTSTLVNYATTASVTAAVSAATYTPGAPVSRTLSYATAYQATQPSKPAFVSVNIQSVYTLTIATTLNDVVELRIGPNNTVASGGGTAVAQFRSSLTGVSVSIGMGSAQMSQLSATIPPNWWFSLIRTTGSTATIASAFDYSLLP